MSRIVVHDEFFYCGVRYYTQEQLDAAADEGWERGHRETLRGWKSIEECWSDARNETVRGIYDHLFNKGAAYQWPNVLNTIRVWAEDNGLEDPK